MAKAHAFLRRGSCSLPDKPAPAAKTPQRFVDRNLAGAGTEEQFAPTEAAPVPQQYKMAGGA
jgi:hypothetical protein